MDGSWSPRAICCDVGKRISNVKDVLVVVTGRLDAMSEMQPMQDNVVADSLLERA